MDFLCASPFASSLPAPPLAAYPSPTSFDSSSSSSSSPLFNATEAFTTVNGVSASPHGVRGGRGAGRVVSVVSDIAGKLVSGLLTCIFAVVGAFVGAVTGALIGLATESGLFRGAGIGAISGAVFSIDAVEASLVLWRSDGSGIWSILYVIDIITSLLSGRLVREKVGPAVQSAVQSQMSAIDVPTPFQDVLDIFETGGTKGMSRSSIEKLPKIKVTAKNNMDASGEKICCSVCLQDFQPRETARILPHCQHMFHLPCIDNWLTRHGSCPLCRRDF